MEFTWNFIFILQVRDLDRLLSMQLNLGHQRMWYRLSSQ